jgi:hypothetical protein
MTAKKLCVLGLLALVSLALVSAEVVNKDRPRRGEWDLKLEKIWESGRAGAEVLGRPQGLLVLDDGTLYLNDDANRKDYAFGPKGEFVRSFAARGSGPGEVQRHGRFFEAGDKIVIADIGRLHYFAKDGTYLRSVAKDCEPRAFLDEDRLIDAPLSAVHLPEGKGRIVLCDLRSGRDRVLAEFSAFKGGVARDREAAVDVIVPLFSPLMTIGHAGDRLYWGMSDRYRIQVGDMAGGPITSFSVERRKTKVSAKDKRDYFDKGGMPPDLLKQIVDGLPDELTYFHRIEVHNDLIYVYVTDIDLENKRLRIGQIDVFFPDGTYLYRIRLDFGRGRTSFYSPLQNLVIKNGYLYAVLLDEDDRAMVAKFKASLPAL